MSTIARLTIIVVTLGLAACTQAPAEQDPAPVATTVEGSATPDTPTPAPAPASTASPTPLVRGLPPSASLTLTTATSGVGPRPVLAWEAVEPAAVYSVVVLDAQGVPYWGWETEDTHVRVGLSERPAQAPGPRITDGMTWSVVAHDRDGVPIAVSEVRPVAP